MKDQVIDIFEQAKGKRFTYLILELSNGTTIQTCIERLGIDSMSEKAIYLYGENMEWAENASISLTNIEDVIERAVEDYDMEDADHEYEILYEDGSNLLIQICYEFNY